MYALGSEERPDSTLNSGTELILTAVCSLLALLITFLRL